MPGMGLTALFLAAPIFSVTPTFPRCPIMAFIIWNCDLQTYIIYLELQNSKTTSHKAVFALSRLDTKMEQSSKVMERAAKLEWKPYQHNIEKDSWLFIYNERKRMLPFPLFDCSAILENGKAEEISLLKFRIVSLSHFSQSCNWHLRCWTIRPQLYLSTKQRSPKSKPNLGVHYEVRCVRTDCWIGMFLKI